MKLKIATCQFPVCEDPRANARRIMRQMRSAKKRGGISRISVRGRFRDMPGSMLIPLTGSIGRG